MAFSVFTGSKSILSSKSASNYSGSRISSSKSKTVFNQSNHRRVFNIVGKNGPYFGSTSRLSVDLKID